MATYIYLATISTSNNVTDKWIIQTRNIDIDVTTRSTHTIDCVTYESAL